jgi:hypothetical protein
MKILTWIRAFCSQNITTSKLHATVNWYGPLNRSELHGRWASRSRNCTYRRELRSVRGRTPLVRLPALRLASRRGLHVPLVHSCSQRRWSRSLGPPCSPLYGCCHLVPPGCTVPWQRLPLVAQTAAWCRQCAGRSPRSWTRSADETATGNPRQWPAGGLKSGT